MQINDKNNGGCFSIKRARVIITPAIACSILTRQEHVFNWPFSNWKWLKQDAIGGKMMGTKEKQEFIKHISSFLCPSCTHNFNELLSLTASWFKCLDFAQTFTLFPLLSLQIESVYSSIHSL